MYENILIPVVLEDSPITRTAFNAARALADTGARITLLHVIETMPIYLSEYFPPELLPTARATVERELDKLSGVIPGAKTAIVEGKAGPGITRWAENHDVDCIIVASHQPEISDYLLGSVAQYVVRHATCAVHVIR